MFTGNIADSMTLYIKNMVCYRCILAVKSILQELQIPCQEVYLGKVEMDQSPTPGQLLDLDTALRKCQLELMEDRKKVLVERIKVHILELLHREEADRLKLSDSLSKSLHYDYTYLSNHFSEMEGSTIERFYLAQRTERVKELIVYEGLSVTEIAYRLHYSSVSYLCAQFRKITGITPAVFRRKTAQPDFQWREIKS